MRFNWRANAAALTALIIVNLESRACGQSQPGATMETGSLITNRPASVNGSTKDDARYTTRQFGQCVVRNTPKQAADLALMPVDDARYVGLMERISVSECLGAGRLKMPGSILRGTVIEALYLLRYANDRVTNLATKPAIDYVQGYHLPLSPSAANAIALARFGDCVVRRDPSTARQLVAALPASDLEASTFNKVMPNLGPCIPAGQQVAFSRSIIRYAIAEGLYRLSMVSDVAAK